MEEVLDVGGLDFSYFSCFMNRVAWGVYSLVHDSLEALHISLNKMSIRARWSASKRTWMQIVSNT